MEAIDEAKKRVLDSVKTSNPTIDPSCIELIYTEPIKAYEAHLKYIEELNKKNQENS
jgi:hypothetical protein